MLTCPKQGMPSDSSSPGDSHLSSHLSPDNLERETPTGVPGMTYLHQARTLALYYAPLPAATSGLGTLNITKRTFTSSPTRQLPGDAWKN